MAIFKSILFNDPSRNVSVKKEPLYIKDLHLDSVLNQILSNSDNSDLRPFYYTLLQDEEAIYYRQHIMQDLENPELFELVKQYSQKIKVIIKEIHDSKKFHYAYQRERSYLEIASVYCMTIRKFAFKLSNINLHSKGFLSLRTYIIQYQNSDNFIRLCTETQNLKEQLTKLNYKISINGLSVKVLPIIKKEDDYVKKIESTFACLKYGQSRGHIQQIEVDGSMNHIDELILKGVASLYPQIFESLKDFYVSNMDFYDERIVCFGKEVQFYILYIDYISNLKESGLPFCYPTVSVKSKDESVHGTFDLALAIKLLQRKEIVVKNDYFIKNDERIMIITGPNQGGKTTFARMIGQLHYLSAIGFPIPGNEVKIFICDNIFTHFEKQEQVEKHLSKLEDDLIRIHNILIQCTENSLLIMNEILSSTTCQDALEISQHIMHIILKLKMLCVWVTFLDELTVDNNDKVVSLMSCVQAENPTKRTFLIKRKPANGLAYALSIAEKYQVTYNYLLKRIHNYGHIAIK